MFWLIGEPLFGINCPKIGYNFYGYVVNSVKKIHQGKAESVENISVKKIKINTSHAEWQWNNIEIYFKNNYHLVRI